MKTSDVLSASAPWAIEQGDCLQALAQLPDRSVDLVLGSPPYEQARLYLENGEDLGMARDTEQWVAWMVDVFKASLRVCKGLVAFVVEGQTRDFAYSGGPLLLGADLLRSGITLRHPVCFHRIGIPGSGGKASDHAEAGGSADGLRNDWEFVLLATNGGKLPWADTLAMGHTPKWAPGGEMSYRQTDGTRRNQWGGSNDGPTDRATDAMQVDGTRQKKVRPSHRVNGHGCHGSPTTHGRHKARKAPGGRGRNADGTHKKRRAPAGMNDSGDANYEDSYDSPAIANPGNNIEAIYTADQVAEMMQAESDWLHLNVGGGVMGNKLCHANEAPYPESLCEFFIRSFCQPGGIVCDPFSGSGTTVSVAVACNRRGIGFDLRQSQVDLGRHRVQGVTPEALFS